jgi:glucose-1-phosphate thymidylyltransferase
MADSLTPRTTTQAVILARGLGTRMRARGGAAASRLDDAQTHAAEQGAKAMMPFGRPFLDYVLSALADAGIADVVLVVGPEQGDIRSYYTQTAPPRRLRVHFAVQDDPRGTADAVLASKAAVRDAPFLVLNSDNYYPVGAYRALAAVGGAGLVAFEAEALVRESGIERERVFRYALIEADENGWLRSAREKPSADDPLAKRAERWVSMNLWSFTPRIFEACARVNPSVRGELELVDAVNIAMNQLGERFRVIPARAGVLDLSSRGDVAFVASRLSAIHATP